MPTRFPPLAPQILACLLTVLTVPSLAGKSGELLREVSLQSETLQAFHNYISKTDQKNVASLAGGNFLWVEDLSGAEKAAAYHKLSRGEVLIQRQNPGSSEISAGMIHDWEGMVFIPGVNLQQVLFVLQDYDHHAIYFSPDVERAKILEHNGDHYRILLRFRRKNVITVVLDTEHDVHYFPDSPTRSHSRSTAIRIAEVDHPGEPSEKEKTPGQDNGFLWRMETWWRLEEKDGGVYVQNRVVSLTRDIPVGLGWIAEPFVTSIPKESLAFTLGAVRKTVLAKSKSAH